MTDTNEASAPLIYTPPPASVLQTPRQPALSENPTPAEAASVLASRTADKGWGKKLMDGDAETNREYHQLTALVAKGDAIEHALAGVHPSRGQHYVVGDGEQPFHVIAGTVEHFRQAGVTKPEVIRELMEGHPIAREAQEATARFRDQLHRDEAWVKRLMSGDIDARRQHTLICGILSLPIKEDGAG